MFLDNRASRIYFQIIERSKIRTLDGYCERHHIIPLSLGGLNHQDNIARLTAREHYLAHLLLCRMTIGAERRSMIFAFSRMNSSGLTHQRHTPKARWYEHHRQLLSEAMRSRTVTAETRAKISLIASNRSAESRLKMQMAKNKPCTIDGVNIFPSKKLLAQSLGWGKSGAASPSFRYISK